MQDYISLAQASKLCPGRLSIQSIWRWCRKGIKSKSGERIHLEHYRVGGKLYTTENDLQNFFKNVTESDKLHFQKEYPKIEIPKTRSAARRKADIDRAMQSLNNDGFDIELPNT